MEKLGNTEAVFTYPKGCIHHAKSDDVFKFRRRSAVHDCRLSSADVPFSGHGVLAYEEQMVKYLYGRISVQRYISADGEHGQPDYGGVLLRKSRGVYACAPEAISPVLLAAVRKLNVEVAFTMRTETTKVILSTLEPHQSEVLLTNGSQLQVVDSLAEIASSSIKKFQYACLVRQEGMMLVWHDDLQQILPHARALEEKLLSLVSLEGVSSINT